MKSLESQFEWLRFDLERLPQKEKFEFSIKKSLLAASAVFALEQNLSGDTLNVEGHLQAKVPFKGNYEFEATSVSHRVQTAMAFSIYKEFKDDAALRLWLDQAGTLKCIPEGEAPKRELSAAREGLPAGSILNSLTLLSVFSAQVPVALAAKTSVFAAQFVASDKLFAVKFKFNEAQTTFGVFAKEIAEPVTSDEWMQLEWPANAMVEGSWNSERRAVSALRVRVPVLGALELPLTQLSRE